MRTDIGSQGVYLVFKGLCGQFFSGQHKQELVMPVIPPEQGSFRRGNAFGAAQHVGGINTAGPAFHCYQGYWLSLRLKLFGTTYWTPNGVAKTE